MKRELVHMIMRTTHVDYQNDPPLKRDAGSWLQRSKVMGLSDNNCRSRLLPQPNTQKCRDSSHYASESQHHSNRVRISSLLAHRLRVSLLQHFRLDGCKNQTTEKADQELRKDDIYVVNAQ